MLSRNICKYGQHEVCPCLQVHENSGPQRFAGRDASVEFRFEGALREAEGIAHAYCAPAAVTAAEDEDVEPKKSAVDKFEYLCARVCPDA
jgi:hypothetical protein